MAAAGQILSGPDAMRRAPTKASTRVEWRRPRARRAPSPRRDGRGRCGRPPGRRRSPPPRWPSRALRRPAARSTRSGTTCATGRPGAAGPSAASRSRPASTARLCSARLAKPRPGSTISWSRCTPQSRRAPIDRPLQVGAGPRQRRRRTRRARTCPRPAPRVHQDDRRAACGRPAAQGRGRTRSPLMSLTMTAPSSSASAATSAL